MAKVISAEIAATPVNVTATPVAGGSLPIGTTYYYRIVHVGPGNNYYQGNSGMWWRSIPCVEVSATTDAVNRTIRLEWDKALADTAVVMFYRSEVSGDYVTYDRATGVWTPHLLLVGSSPRAYGELIGNLLDLGVKWGWEDNGSKTIGTCPIIESGVCRITMSGGDSGDRITPTDIADWMVANGHGSRVDMMDFYDSVLEPVVVKMRATIQNSGVTYFGIRPRQHFIQEWGKWWTDADCHIKIGDRSSGEPDNGAIWQIYSAYAWYSGFYGELELNDSVIWAMPLDVANQLYAGYTGGMFHLYNRTNPCGMYSSIYIAGEKYATGRVTAENIVLSNTIFKAPSAEFSSSRGAFVGTQLSNYINVSYRARQLTFVGCFTLRIGAYDIIHMNNYDAFDNCALFIDCDFGGSGSNGILPAMNKIFNPAVRSWMDTMIFKSVNLSVADDAGNPMPGAVMTVKDATGYGVEFIRLDSYVDNDVYTGTALTVTDASEIDVGDVLRLNLEKVLVTNKVGNDLTIERQYEGSPLRSTDDGTGGAQIYVRKPLVADADGVFPEIFVMHDYHTVQQDGSSGTHMYYPADFVSVNPITITISKDGYWDYESVFELEEPVQDTIGLLPLSNTIGIPVEVSVGNPNIDVVIDVPEITVEVDCG